MLGFTRLLRRAREAEADEATDASDEDDSASCSSEGSDVFFEASEVAASGGEEDFAPALICFCWETQARGKASCYARRRAWPDEACSLRAAGRAVPAWRQPL